jgi:hypothetical protein
MNYSNGQCCGGDAGLAGTTNYCGCGCQYPVVPGLNPALQTWNGQNFVVADGSYQLPIYLPNLQQFDPTQVSNVIGMSATGQLVRFADVQYAPNNALVTATGSTTPRTLANRFADVVNVKDFGATGDGVTDDTAAIQAAVNSLPINGTLYFPQGTYNVVTISFISKSNFWIQLDGKLASIASKPAGANVDARSTQAGVAPVLKFNSCTVFEIYGKGSISNLYREAIYIYTCNDFNISINLIGTGVNDNLSGVQIQYCNRFFISSMIVSAVTYKPISNYNSWSNNLFILDSTDFVIDKINTKLSGMNGIYVGSNCSNFTLSNNLIQNNSGSGIQLAWSSYGNFPIQWVVCGNQIHNNLSDGIDVNNTSGSTVITNGTIANNMLSINGWVGESLASGTPGPDGSGIGTFANIDGFCVSNNQAIEPARAGIYLLNCNNAKITNNYVLKSNAGTINDGIYVQTCNNILINGNNITVPSSINALNLQPTLINVIIDSNTLNGILSIANGTYTGCKFTKNKCTAYIQFSVFFDFTDNYITVTNSSQNAVYVSNSSISISRNYISATNYGIVCVSQKNVAIEGNTVSASTGSIRLDTCTSCSVRNNTTNSTSSTSIGFVNVCTNCEISNNSASSTSGNSFNIGASCITTNKWGNTIVAGTAVFNGTYGINY